MIMDVDSELAAAVCGRIPKLKRKRSSEQLMLRKTVPNKVFLQDLQHNPAIGPSSNVGLWPSEVCDINMNISDELSEMMSTKCLIEKGRWMLPQQCVIGKVNYKFAVIGYSYDPSDRPMGDNAIGRLSFEMKQSNDDAQMMFGNRDGTRTSTALSLSKCVKKLFDEPNAQQIQGTWPSQRCSDSDQMASYGVISAQRSLSEGQLNGNISYSYRTHYYLNR